MTQEEAEKATQFLVDTAYKYGDAKARRMKAEHMLKHFKAIYMKASQETAISAQERDALASDDYKAAVEEIFNAAVEENRLAAAREAATVRVDFWRSVSARQRGA